MVDPDARPAHYGLDPAERGHPEPMSEGPGGGAPGKRRILIVDGNPLLRRGLAALIDNEPDLAVCAQAATAREALDALDATRPDLVLVDFSFERGLGLDLVRAIRASRPPPPVLMMSIDDAPVYAERAFLAGASGCVSKQALDGTALAAIRAVLDSGTHFGGGQLTPGRRDA